MSAVDRFWSKVSGRGSEGCWEWQAGRTDGYGMVHHEGRMTRAHRFVLSVCEGLDIGGLHVHHRCANKLCVNPEHLEAMSASEHARLEHPRSAACMRGHAWTEENTRIDRASGERKCRACDRERARARRARVAA